MESDSNIRAVGGIESVAFSPDGPFDRIRRRRRDRADLGLRGRDRGTRRFLSGHPTARPPAPILADQKKEQSEAKNRRPAKTMFRTFFREQSEVVCDVVWDQEAAGSPAEDASKIKFWDLKNSKEISTIDFLAQCLSNT